MEEALIQEPVAVLAVLLGVLAGLFALASHPAGERFFRVVPLLIFAYFVPTALSNLGLIPLRSPIYDVIKTWLLPASLILLTMSVDIPAILRLDSEISMPTTVLVFWETDGIKRPYPQPSSRT